MGRTRKLFERPVDKFRDCRLIIIASEGSKTEKNYFDALAVFYKNTKVHVKFIEAIDTSSDPEHVFERLDGFYQEYDLGKDDNLYLVIDRDRWQEGTLSEIAATCNQKDFIMTLSNPNFELWLLLHEKDISLDDVGEQSKIQENKKVNKTRSYLEFLLGDLWGGYNKSNCKFEHIMDKVNI